MVCTSTLSSGCWHVFLASGKHDCMLPPKERGPCPPSPFKVGGPENTILATMFQVVFFFGFVSFAWLWQGVAEYFQKKGVCFGLQFGRFWCNLFHTPLLTLTFVLLISVKAPFSKFTSSNSSCWPFGFCHCVFLVLLLDLVVLKIFSPTHELQQMLLY